MGPAGSRRKTGWGICVQENPQFLSPHGRDIKGCPLMLFKWSFSKKQKKDIVLLTEILKIVSNEAPIKRE
jgi:hypothetical protein